MRLQNCIRIFNNTRIRVRLLAIQKRFGLKDEARQILHNEIEAASKFWFIQGGGKEAEFESKFNEK